jgi:thiol-disulfide isomerase/thioredoxin
VWSAIKKDKEVLSPFFDPVAAYTPNFTLVTQMGRSIDIEEVRGGRPAIVYIWGTWCKTCVEDLPALAGVSERFKDTIVMIPIALDQTGDMPTRILKDFPTLIPYYDDRGHNADAVHITQLPTVLLMNRQGEIIAQGKKDIDWQDAHLLSGLCCRAFEP